MQLICKDNFKRINQTNIERIFDKSDAADRQEPSEFRSNSCWDKIINNIISLKKNTQFKPNLGLSCCLVNSLLNL